MREREGRRYVTDLIGRNQVSFPFRRRLSGPPFFLGSRVRKNSRLLQKVLQRTEVVYLKIYSVYDHGSGTIIETTR